MPRTDDHRLLADLSAYLDGELSEVRAQEVRRLLEQSEHARLLLDDLRAVSDQLAALPRLQAPDALTVAMARQAERALLFENPRLRRRARLWRLSLYTSGAAALLFAGVLVGQLTGQRGSSTPGGELAKSYPAQPSALTTLRERVATGDQATAARGGREGAVAVTEPEAQDRSAGETPALAMKTAPAAVSPVDARVSPGEALVRWAEQGGGTGGGTDPRMGRAQAGGTMTAPAPEQSVVGAHGQYVTAEADEPAIVVQIQSANSRDYENVNGLLTEWVRESPETAYGVIAVDGKETRKPVDTPASVFRQGTLEFGQVAVTPVATASDLAFRFPAHELADRVQALSGAVGPPSRVDVQLNFYVEPAREIQPADRDTPTPLAAAAPARGAADPRHRAAAPASPPPRPRATEEGDLDKNREPPPDKMRRELASEALEQSTASAPAETQPANMPAGLASQPASEPPIQTLTDRLLDLLFAHRWVAQRELGLPPASAPTDEVRFRVMVLPPPPTSEPAGSTESQPSDRPQVP